TYTAVPIHLDGPDLVASSASADATGIVGGAVSISWTVTNQSTTTALASYWYDVFYLSDDATFSPYADLQIGSSFVASPPAPLAAGAHYDASTSVTIPYYAGTGAKYLFVVADGYNYQGETDETNNASAAIPITVVAPDLTITAVTAPSSAIPNGAFQVS